MTPGYFPAMGLPIVRGRNFTDADGPEAPAVAIVNEALVRSYFGSEEPIGRRILFDRARPGMPPPTAWTIVGVARDEKQNSLNEDVKPAVYESHRQNATLGMAIVVRADMPPASLVPALRRELAALDKGVAMFDIQTLREVVDESISRRRFAAWIVGLFSALALTIAAVGLYGIMSYRLWTNRRSA